MRNGTSLLGVTAYRRVPLGSMGYTTGIVTASDESWQLVKTDGAGAWRRDGLTGAWEQCFRRSNTSAAMFDFDPSLGEADGTWEAEIALSDPTVAYASWRHRIMKSTDSGNSWTLCTAVPQMNMNGNSQGGSPASYQRLSFGKLAIDPSNADVVYWAPEGEGLLRTLDGMATYSKIASVPDAVSPYSRSQDDDRYCLIAIDDTSALTSGRHSIVYVASIGNGVYRSSDGGNTFSQISGTLLYPSNIMCIGGVLWLFNELTTGNVSAGGANFYTYNGSWSSAFGPTNQNRFVAIDPVVSTTWYAGRLMWRSTNSGSTWSDIPGGAGTNITATGHDAPLMANVFNSVRSLFSARFSTASNGRIYAASGYGIVYFESANFRAAGAGSAPQLVMHEDTAGIENIVPQASLITPNGSAFMVNQDKAIVKMADTGEFPSTCYPINQYSGNGTNLTNGYDIDYAAQDPNYLAAVINKNSFIASYTTDDGASWQAFPTNPTTKQGGCLAVIDVGKIVYVPGQNGWPMYSHDGGSTWTDCTFSGFAKITSGETGWGFGTTDTDRFIVCNDKDNPLTVYAYNYGVAGNASSGGLWRSTDGGINFTRMTSSNIVNNLLDGYANQLRHRSGILWLNSHYTTPYNSENVGAYLHRSTDEGATWSQVGGLSEPYYYTFGKARFGNDYPALYALGWVGGVNGLWRCDNADTADAADMAWTRLTQSQEFARPATIAGDPSAFGRLLIGRGGMSYEEAYYDYSMRLS